MLLRSPPLLSTVHQPPPFSIPSISHRPPPSSHPFYLPRPPPSFHPFYLPRPPPSSHPSLLPQPVTAGAPIRWPTKPINWQPGTDVCKQPQGTTCGGNMWSRERWLSSETGKMIIRDNLRALWIGPIAHVKTARYNNGRNAEACFAQKVSVPICYVVSWVICLSPS